MIVAMTRLSMCGCVRLWNMGTDAYELEDNSAYFINEGATTDFIPENSTNMEGTKFSEIQEAPALNAMSIFIGIQDNGDGTFTNYAFTSAQLATYIKEQTSKDIEATEDGDTLTDEWFDGKTIRKIFTDNQTYIRGVGFSQDGDTITGIGNSFYDGQILIAET